MVDGGCARKHWLASHHFSDQATKRPNINFLRVIFTAKEELRSTIPSGSNVISHDDSLIILGFFKGPDEAKVTQFGIAVFINEDIGGLEVSMNDVGVVKVQNGFCQLVNDVLFVSFLKVFVIAILSNKCMKVNIHVFEDEINVLVILGSDDVIDFDDILLFELFKEHDFSVGSLGIGGVGKGIKIFFKGLKLFGFAISDFPDDSVSSTSNFLNGLIQSQHVRLYFVRHSNLLSLTFIYLYNLSITELIHYNSAFSISHLFVIRFIFFGCLLLGLWYMICFS